MAACLCLCNDSTDASNADQHEEHDEEHDKIETHSPGEFARDYAAQKPDRAHDSAQDLSRENPAFSDSILLLQFGF